MSPPHRELPEPVLAPDSIPRGAHLTTPRRGYTHHGLYAGDGRVIHYAGFVRSWRPEPVREVSLAEFADGRPVFVQPAGVPTLDADTVLRRARSRLGESRYTLLRNNCEHFVNWCVHGQSRSEQVERAQRWLQRFVSWNPLALLDRSTHTTHDGTANGRSALVRETKKLPTLRERRSDLGSSQTAQSQGA